MKNSYAVIFRERNSALSLPLSALSSSLLTNSNPGEENVDRTLSYFDIQNIALHYYLVMEKEKKRKKDCCDIYVNKSACCFISLQTHEL